MSDTLDLKKTVNLPNTAFAQKANLSQNEPARLQKWTDAKLYEQILETRKNAQKFVLHDGPPYANADIHIGTALNKVLKDMIVKSRTMMGFDAPFVPGYDCHGLPIESFVEKKLEKEGKKKHELSAGEFRRICREHASTAMNNQTRDFKRLGILGEWDNPYLTMSNEYEAETARLFGKFVERGYVYKGLKPVYWCVTDQTALAEAEIEYHDHTSPSVYVKFPLKTDPAEIDPALKDKNVFAVIWTTTPWTLPANLGISVHPDFDYSAVEAANGEVYILASELVNTVAEKTGLGEVKELARFKGAKLDRMEARHPWIDRTSLIMNGEHVTLGGGDSAADDEEENSGGKSSGTGLVHTAPGHGTDDYNIGRQYDLEVYNPVDNAGKFVADVEHFAGENIFKANPKIVEFMQERGVLLYAEQYQHRYPHCWRCKRPIIFRATPQWFIAMDQSNDGTKLRDGAMRDIANHVNWHPKWGQHRMSNMFNTRPDWCVSRQRLWGVPIPVFYCAGCDGAVADHNIINHVADIFAQETADAWYNRESKDLLPDGYKCEGCGGTDFRKETDILDVWFDSGSSCVAVLEQRENLHYPADVYIEGGDQYRGWFNSSLMCGLAKHDRAPYLNVLTHGWVVDGEGRKQSKSLGNVTSPNKIVDQYGADILRMWAAAVDYTEDVRSSEEIFKRVADAYRKMRNTLRYGLGNLDGFDPAQHSVAEADMQEIDRWALAELNGVIAKTLDAYERFDFQGVYMATNNFVTVTLSARYFDIIKDRLYTAAPDSPKRRSAQTAIYLICDALCRLMAPILSFTSDEAWENLPGQSVPSVHLAEFPEVAPASRRLSSERLAHSSEEEPGTGHSDAGDTLFADWERVFAVRDEVLKSLEEARTAKLIGSGLDAKVKLTVNADTYSFLQKYEGELRYIFIVSQVELMSGDASKVEIDKADGTKCERCWNYSTEVGNDEKYPTVCERCAPVLPEFEKALAV